MADDDGAVRNAKSLEEARWGVYRTVHDKKESFGGSVATFDEGVAVAKALAKKRRPRLTKVYLASLPTDEPTPHPIEVRRSVLRNGEWRCNAEWCV